MTTHTCNNYAKHEKISQTWLTLTDLGALFGKTPREMSFYLEEVGLRTFDPYYHQHLPTALAQSQEFCISASSHRKTLFYLWHKEKLSRFLQETLSLPLLKEADFQARNLALQFLRYCKKQSYIYHAPFDPLYDVLFAPNMPTILAWYLIEERKKSEVFVPNSRDLLTIIDACYFHLINNELERLNSEIHLDVYNYTVRARSPAFVP